MATLPKMLRRLWSRLSARRKRQFAGIVALIFASAVAEVVSLGAVLPFLAVLAVPDKVLKYPFVAPALRAFGVTTSSDLVFALALGFACAAAVAGVLRTLLLRAMTRVAYSTGADFSVEVYRRTLYQPYQVQITRNSSELISGITGKLAETVNILNQILLLISASVLVVFIMSALFFINPAVAGLAMASFGSGYAAITYLSRKQLRMNGQRAAAAHTQVVKALQEGLGGIRDVLLDGTQPAYCEIYSRAEYEMRRAYGNIVFASASPRYAMEALGMVLIAALAFGLSRTTSGLSSAIPALAALALGAQRLLPVLQQGYSAWATISGGQQSLAVTLDLLSQPLPPEALEPAPAPLPFKHSVQFSSVSFRYASGPWVLNDVDLTIRRGMRVGFVGSTGSGKSTLLDLLMGLLPPTQGQLLVDGEALSGSRVRSWQRVIAHVPQSIFLADRSVAENIAFGVAPAAIDMERVRFAARQAQISEFIEARPEGYEAWVGERGIQLSGGQRQRIGIARALYKKASVLVFDEATSALDNATEQSVMDAIDGLDRELTILLIAHRLTTVRRCDVIVELEHGRMVGQGSYEEMLKSSSSFRNMVRTVA
jgi:ABC-type multidrug transport system fused ATPase/permease subunit